MPSPPLRRYGICIDCTEVVAEGEPCACQSGGEAQAVPAVVRTPLGFRAPRLAGLRPALWGLGAGVAAIVFLLSAS